MRDYDPIDPSFITKWMAHGDKTTKCTFGGRIYFQKVGKQHWILKMGEYMYLKPWDVITYTCPNLIKHMLKIKARKF